MYQSVALHSLQLSLVFKILAVFGLGYVNFILMIFDFLIFLVNTHTHAHALSTLVSLNNLLPVVYFKEHV